MTEADAVEAISATWRDRWPAASSAAIGTGVPYSFEGENVDSQDYFAACVIQPLGRVQITTGPRPRFQSSGIVRARIWTPTGVGVLPAAKLCDAVRLVLERQQVGGALFVEPVTFGAGASLPGAVDGRWYRREVQTPFVYYDQAP